MEKSNIEKVNMITFSVPMSILFLLRDSPSPLTSSQITKKLGIAASTFYIITPNFAKIGLVKEKGIKKGTRFVKAYLITKKGKSLLDELNKLGEELKDLNFKK